MVIEQVKCVKLTIKTLVGQKSRLKYGFGICFSAYIHALKNMSFNAIR